MIRGTATIDSIALGIAVGIIIGLIVYIIGSKRN